ncbi:MAG TPA: M56 family metallopeptidase [Rhodanobacteraceae bacterium]|jgi:beta-lactamase regulating signal transducer with metallopeptidase domain|nr:M56 family metallopeptidase [Rhodanobacteraceae bacterium]
MASEIYAAWLLTFGLHASVLLSVAWLIDRGSLRARPAWREMLWRAAFFGGVVTASAQVLLDTPAPTRIRLSTNSSAGGPEVVSSITLTQPSKDRPENIVPVERAHIAAQSSTTPSIAKAETIVSEPASTPSRGVPFAFPSWHLMLIAGWLAGALIALTRLAAAWLGLRRSLKRAEPVHKEQLATDVAALAIQAGIEAPRLGALDDLASPIAARGRILLPHWAIDLLDREQLRAMLAHETAHIARRDPDWKLAIATWSALFWFVPLATLARRRLDEVAEISCDAWAAIHLGDGRSLAECLAECAERRIGGIDIALAPAMAGRESPLLQRIDYLIAGVPMNTRSAGVRAALAVIAALAIAVFALPGVSLQSASAQSAPPSPPSPPSAPTPAAAPALPSAPAVPVAPVAPPAPVQGHHVHISSDISINGQHDLMLVQVSDDKHSYSVKIDGKVEFNDSEDDIESLSDGGIATFSETHMGKTQRVDIASRGGKLERRYFVNDKEQPLDADARKWMAILIPSVIRETAIDAEGRVKRLRAKGGSDAVLDEIAHIDSGYARGVYLRFLAAGGKLSSAQMTRALGLVDAIDSDYEKRNALAALANMQPLDASQQKLVLAQADKINSDYERAELLVGMLPQLAPADDVHAAWLKAASGIHSDYEHRRALSAMLDAGQPDEATLGAVVDAAHTIGSDYERRELLTSAVRRTHDADKLATAYAGAASKIGSDYERREALTALIHAPGFGKTGTRAVLDALPGIGSDYECREVLVALARVMPNDPDLIARYRSVARRLSDSERGEAERALDHFTS